MKRDWLTLAFGIVLVWVVVALSLRQTFTRREEGPPPAASLKVDTGSPPPVPESAAPTPAEPTAAARLTKAPPSRTTEPARPPSSAPVAAPSDGGPAVLSVHSDVPGASVFLDREFVGSTPLTLRGLTTGSKQLNVTATGHEGHSSTITLTEGPNRVTVEFLKVQLDTAVPVIHRHAMGSCQGTLTATTKGLSYATSNKSDAFALTLEEIEEFDVDYLKKNLRIRRREGKTWNFTNDSADALFSFHKAVSTAREKLAK
jgi:hypothetical protein